MSSVTKVFVFFPFLSCIGLENPSSNQIFFFVCKSFICIEKAGRNECNIYDIMSISYMPRTFTIRMVRQTQWTCNGSSFFLALFPADSMSFSFSFCPLFYFLLTAKGRKVLSISLFLPPPPTPGNIYCRLGIIEK